ncbi:MAG: hypothetical protein AAF915_05895 [Cyanobacteria bacterium P01_D01_bin.50]
MFLPTYSLPALYAQLQSEIKANQEQITKVNTKIDKNQQSMSVLVKAMQELINSEVSDKALENQTQENKQSSSEAKSEERKPDSN